MVCPICKIENPTYPVADPETGWTFCDSCFRAAQEATRQHGEPFAEWLRAIALCRYDDARSAIAEMETKAEAEEPKHAAPDETPAESPKLKTDYSDLESRIAAQERLHAEEPRQPFYVQCGHCGAWTAVTADGCTLLQITCTHCGQLISQGDVCHVNELAGMQDRLKAQSRQHAAECQEKDKRIEELITENAELRRVIVQAREAFPTESPSAAGSPEAGSR